MGRPGTWKKGESGNPNGRPPKNRALSEILEKAGSKTIERDGKRLSGKRLIAVLLWELATAGTCTLPNGTVYTVDGEGWFDVVKFLYAQIDGPPKHDVGLQHSGEIGITDYTEQLTHKLNRIATATTTASVPEEPEQ